MRKIIALLIAALLVLSLAACEKNDFLNSNYSLATSYTTESEADLTSSENESNFLPSAKSIIESSAVQVSSKASSLQSTDAPYVSEAPDINITSENDATQANNIRVSDYINSHLQNGENITQTEIDRLISSLVSEDGVTFHNISLLTDTVTMKNLYFEPMSGKFKAVDTKVCSALKNNNKADIDTGFSPSQWELVNEYMNEFVAKYNLPASIYYSGNSNIMLEMKDAVEMKISLEGDIPQKIQAVINECGIKSGMLQAEAIIRFNDYICAAVEYDNVTYTHSLSDFFNKGIATCNSYAQVFELLCRTVGINAEFIADNNVMVGNSYERHAWNRVIFSDGTVAYFDTCWNDGEIVINGVTYQKTDRYMFVKSFTDRPMSSTEICQSVWYMKFK